jgi:propionyl-CoA synthetase
MVHTISIHRDLWCLESGTDHKEYEKQIIALVREHVGPVAALKRVIFVPKLPKTRSGKIARNTLAAMANGAVYKVRRFLLE